jgi:hypothetical protein
MKRTAVLLAAALITCAVVASAQAARRTTDAEYKAIASAVALWSHSSACANRKATFVSTRNPRWAITSAFNNCENQESSITRFFVRRPSPRSYAFKVVATLRRRRTGQTPRCAGPSVPKDIRCGVAGAG